MSQIKTPFLMAVVVAIIGLIWVQLSAPTHLKPLTNRLLEYPGTTPTLTSSRDIMQLSLSSRKYQVLFHSNVRAMLSRFVPQLPQIAYTAAKYYEGDKDAPVITKAPTPKTNSDALVQTTQKTKEPKASDGEAGISNYVAPPTNTPSTASTSTPPSTTIQDIRSDAYATINGDERLRYGDQISTSATFVDQSNAKLCKDGQGTVSGTYCAPNGERYNVNTPGNNEASQAFNQVVAQKVVSLDAQEVIKIAQSQNSANSPSCAQTDLSCQQKLLEQSINTVASQAIVTKNDQLANSITQTYITNQKANDYIKLSESELQKKYGIGNIQELLTNLTEEEKTKIRQTRNALLAISDPNISDQAREVNIRILNNQGYSSDVIDQIIKTANDNQNFLVKSQAYLDTTKTDLQLAQEKCGYDLGCVAKFKRTDLLEGIDPNSAGYKQLLISYSDIQIATAFSDPNKTPYDLAKIACKDSPDCIKYFGSFKREEYLQNIKDAALVATAKTNYQTNLFNMTALKDTDSFANLAPSTQRAITEKNSDITHAFAAYSFKHNEAPKTVVTLQSSEDLAVKFSNEIQANPAILAQFLSEYNSNKAKYDGLIQATGLFNYLVTEKNPIIVAQLKELAKTATINGLSNGGNVLPWNKISLEYKQQARELACKDNIKLCPLEDPEGSWISMYSDAEKAQRLAQIDAQAANYLQEVYNIKTGANISLSTSFSNVATIDNPLVDQKLVANALSFADKKTNLNQTSYIQDKYNLTEDPNSKNFNYNTTIPAYSEAERDQIANEYLDRQLVTETYNVGGGIAAGVAGFSAGMLVCVSTGIGAAISPICGAIGGLVGWGASQVPLYQMTAVEYQEQRQGISDFTESIGFSNNEMASSIIQSSFSNQGAWGDEGAGRSVTTRDNRFALYDAINQSTNGLTIEQIKNNQQAQNNLAIQGLVLNQWEKNQNIQESWTYASAPIAALTGAINVSVGSQLASNVVNRSLGAQSFRALKVVGDMALFVPSSAVNSAQTSLQFDMTGGDATLLSSPEQINYQVCVMTSGVDGCASQLETMNASIDESRRFTVSQAFYTDLLMQGYQTGSGFLSARAEYNGQVTRAQEIGISTTGRTLGEIKIDTDNKLASISETLKVNQTDLERLNNQNLTLTLRTAEAIKNPNIQTPTGIELALGNLKSILDIATQKQAELPQVTKLSQIAPSADTVGSLIASKKATIVVDDATGKPRLTIDPKGKNGLTTSDIETIQRVNEHINVLEQQSTRPGTDFSIRESQLDAVVKTLNILADIAQGKASAQELYIDITIDPGVNPNSRTGGGKTTVIAPLVEALMIDDGIPVLRLAPEKNLAGNIAAVKALGTDFYGTDVYIAQSEKNIQGEVIRQYFTTLDGVEVDAQVIYNRARGKKAPVVIADADTAMFGLNDVVRVDRKLSTSLSETSKAWYAIWKSNPSVTIDEVGTLGGHWSTNLGDPIAINKLKQSPSTLFLKNGNEILQIFDSTNDSEVIKLAKNGGLPLKRRSGTEMSLAPLADNHQVMIIDEAISKALSDKKIPAKARAELERIQNIADVNEKRQAFNTLKKLTPIEREFRFGSGATHSIAMADAYFDAVMSRLTVLSGVAGNDFKGVFDANGKQRVELAYSKTVTGQQYSEVMLRLALQSEGGSKLGLTSTDLAPLKNLTVSPSSVVVDINDMYSYSGYSVGIDASDKLSFAKTGLSPVYDSNQLHKPTSASVATDLGQVSAQLAQEVQAQFKDGKTALAIETNVDKYSLDEATSSHAKAVYESARANNQDLYLALNAGDGKYELYKINGPERSNWELISDKADSAESLYRISHENIDSKPNARLLALFENKTRGENFKPSDGLAKDIAKAIVIANNDTSISENVYQAASRLRTNEGDAPPPYHLIAFVEDARIRQDLMATSDLPGSLLGLLEYNQRNTEGLISLERNTSLMNERQVNQVLAKLIELSEGNSTLQAQLEEMSKQIKQSGAAFETMSAYEKTVDVLHNQYLFTRSRIESIIELALAGGLDAEQAKSLRTSFNLDGQKLSVDDFTQMLAHNFDPSSQTGYHQALAKNVLALKNVPEYYLSGSPSEPVVTRNSNNLASAGTTGNRSNVGKQSFLARSLDSASELLGRINPFNQNQNSNTTPTKSPLALIGVVRLPNFSSFATEDQDGVITKIEKINGELIFTQIEADDTVIASHIFEENDLNLFPTTGAVRYNGQLIPSSDYAYKSISPSKSNEESLQEIVRGTGFNQLTATLDNGDVVVFTATGGVITIGITSNGAVNTVIPTSKDLDATIADISTQLSKLEINGQEIPITSYLTIDVAPITKPSFTSSLATSIKNYFSKSPSNTQPPAKKIGITQQEKERFIKAKIEGQSIEEHLDNNGVFELEYNNKNILFGKENSRYIVFDSDSNRHVYDSLSDLLDAQFPAFSELATGNFTLTITRKSKLIAVVNDLSPLLSAQPVYDLTNTLPSTATNQNTPPDTSDTNVADVDDQANLDGLNNENRPTLLGRIRTWFARFAPAQNLSTFLASPDFQTMSITLRNGEVITFTNLLGNISYSRGTPG